MQKKAQPSATLEQSPGTDACGTACGGYLTGQLGDMTSPSEGKEETSAPTLGRPSLHRKFLCYRLWGTKKKLCLMHTSKTSGLRATSAAFSLVSQYCCCSCLSPNQHADIDRVHVTAQTSRLSCPIRSLASIHLHSNSDQGAVATSFPKGQAASLYTVPTLPISSSTQSQVLCFSKTGIRNIYL